MFAKKVLGVIKSFEVASQRPPIFVSPVDDVLVDCCLCFAHRWKGMAPSYKEMSLQLRKRALGLLLSRLENGVLPWGLFTIVADQVGVARSTISRLWRQARGAREQSLIITPEIASRNNSRAKSLKYSHAEFRQGLKEIPRRRRKTYRSTARAMGVSLNTVQRMLLKKDVCRIHTSSLKPTLTEENKMSRMELALSFVDKNNPSNKIIEHDGGNDYKIPHMGKESLWRRGRLPEVLHVTPAANAWLNPTMDDDSDQESDDSGDEMLFPMSTATSTVAMDGEEGENAPTDGITTTGV